MITRKQISELKANRNTSPDALKAYNEAREQRDREQIAAERATQAERARFAKAPRKTRDEFQIWGNYGCGYDELTASDTRAEALATLREYRENAPEGAYRLKVARIKI